jgi:hypothetical protein
VADDVELRKNTDLYTSIAQPQQQEGSRRRLFKPEVLAPAGGWPQARAAIANGADAIYFGLQEGFNARARASNFAIEEVPELMAWLHERGCKGYTVVNVLVFDEEMQRLEDVIKKLAKECERKCADIDDEWVLFHSIRRAVKPTVSDSACYCAPDISNPPKAFQPRPGRFQRRRG